MIQTAGTVAVSTIGPRSIDGAPALYVLFPPHTGTLLSAPVLFDALNDGLWTAVVVFAAYLFLVLTSGRVVRRTLDYAGVEMSSDVTVAWDAEETGEDERMGTQMVENRDSTVTEDTGRAIGKIENILVLTLMVLEAYTALGVIFAAKSIVRKDDMDGGNTSYYLTGTLANFTYSIVVGVVLHVLLWLIVSFGP